MPKSKSKLSLSKRRERAFILFARGYTNTAVAQDLKVHMDTVAGYRAKYEESIHAQAAANPDFLSQVLANTVRALAELDSIREDAWKHLEDRVVREEHECPRCEHTWTTKVRVAISDQTRAQYHNVLLKAQSERSKLFGLLGVKAEMLAHVENVNTVQRLMLAWMAENLCAMDREKLAHYVETSLRQYLNLSAPIPAAGELVASSVE